MKTTGTLLNKPSAYKMFAIANLNMLSGLLFFTFVWTVAPACGPVEEGQSTTLTCDVNTSGCPSGGVVLEWKAQAPEQVVLQVIRCSNASCGGGYSPQYVSATISPTSSTLTINSVSRTDPINMETKWSCAPCSPRPAVTVCDKLEVYAKPSSPSCIVTENTNTGSEDVESVTLACSSGRIYPKAKCSLYKKTNGGSFGKITKTQTVSSTSVSSNSTYYNSSCSITLTLQELGEGTHSFLGYIYPDVTDGERLVNGSPADRDVTFSFSQVSHTCTTNIVQGYFIGKSARCTCSITSAGNPGGTAQWYRGDNTVGTARVLDVTYEKNSAVQTYSCEAKSALGRKSGSTLTARFAFLDTDSVQVAPPSSPIKLCDNNKQAQVLCRISKDNVNPAPTFSFSLDGLLFDKTGTESSDGSFYQRQYSFSQDVGGEYQVFCRVTNTVLSTSEDQSTQVVFQKPPPSPPQITIGSQNYQGTAASNMVTVAEGYTGDVTCRVEGGYPDAVNTILECGTRKDTGVENTATLSFKNNPLMKDMDGAECTCTSSHISGCYSNKNTRLTLNVIYPPEVTLARDPTKTIFNKGDHVRFTCSAQGNPDPSLTLTRQRTDEVLINVQTPTLTHTLDPLKCLDTGVYVCSGQNSQGTDSKDISINVGCPQEFSPLFDPLPVIDAVMGTTAQFDIDVYGFPEPSLLSLSTIDNTNITRSGRHRVMYTATDAPFGNVTVTVIDIEDADFTNYTLRVGNGVGDALIYTFYLNEVRQTTTLAPTTEKGEVNATPVDPGQEGQSGGSDSGTIIGVVIGVVVLIILVVVVVVVILHRRGQLPGQKKSQGSAEKGNHRLPLEEDYEETTNRVYNMEDGAHGKHEAMGLRQSGYVEKKNPVYASGNEVFGNGRDLRESDYVEKQNPVYASSSGMGARPSGNELDFRESDYVEKVNPVYATGGHVPSQHLSTKVNPYRDYTEVENTMVSASAAPANMSNTYEAVGNFEKSKPGAPPKPKPKPGVAAKPPHNNSAPGSPPVNPVEHTLGPSEEPYATISQVNKAPKQPSTFKPDDAEEDFYPDPSTKPDVPDKEFDVYATGGEVTDQPYGNFPDGNVNVGFTNDDENVYANTGPAGMSS